MRPWHVQLFPSKDGWRFRIVAGNGRIVAPSQAYATKSNAKRAAKRWGLEVIEVAA
ncbi:MAG: YegP family protein [Actinomycetota bacterium]